MASWLSEYERVEEAPSKDSRPEWLREYDQVEAVPENLSFTEGIKRGVKRGTIGMEAGVRGQMAGSYESALAPAIAEQKLQGGPNLELGAPSTPEVIEFMQKNPDFAQVRSQAVRQYIESQSQQDRLENDPSLAKSPDAEMPQDGGFMDVVARAKNWRWWTENVSELAPQFAAQVATAALTRGEAIPSMVGFGAAAAIPESGNIYTEARKRGADHITAWAEGNLAGVGVAAMDMLPGSELLLKNPASKKVFGKFLSNRLAERAARTGASAAAEGATEAAQEAWADTMRWVAENDPKAFDGWRMRYPAVAMLGGAVGGIGAIATKPTEDLGGEETPPQPAAGATPQQPAAPATPPQTAAQPAMGEAVAKGADALWANSPDLAQAIVTKVADGGRISREDWRKVRETAPDLPNKVSSGDRDQFAKALADRQPKAAPTNSPAPTTTLSESQNTPENTAPTNATTPTNAPTLSESPTPEAVASQATELTYEDFAKQYSEAFRNAMQYSPDQVGSRRFTDEMASLADRYPDFLDRLEKSLQNQGQQPVDLEDVTPEVADQIRKDGDPIEDADRNETGWIGQRTPTGMTLVHPEQNKVKRFEINSKVGGDFPTKLAEARQWAADNKVKITPRVTPKVEKPIKSEAPAKKGFKKPAQEPWQMTRADWDARGSIPDDPVLNELESRKPKIKRGQQGDLAAMSAHENALRAWNEEYRAALKSQHKRAVEQAIREGKPVPREVLADYPDLRSIAKPTTAASMDQDARAGDSGENVVPTSSQEGPNRGQEETDAQGQQAQADGRQEGLLSPSEAPAAGDTTAPAPKPASVAEAGDDYAAKLKDKITERLGGKSESKPQADPKAETPKPKRKFKKPSEAIPGFSAKASRAVRDQAKTDRMDLDSSDGADFLAFARRFYDAGRQGKSMPTPNMHPDVARRFYDIGRSELTPASAPEQTPSQKLRDDVLADSTVRNVLQQETDDATRLATIKRVAVKKQAELVTQMAADGMNEMQRNWANNWNADSFSQAALKSAAKQGLLAPKPSPAPPPAPAPAPAPQTERDRLRAELAEKAKKFADAVRSKLYSNPLDPELVGMAADMTLTAVKLGAVEFKAFVQEMVDTLGRKMTSRSARYLRAAWDIVREDFPSDNLEESSDIDSVLQEIEDEAAAQRTDTTGAVDDQVGVGSQSGRGQTTEPVATDSAEVPAVTGETGQPPARDTGDEQRTGELDTGDAGAGDASVASGGTGGSRSDQPAGPAKGSKRGSKRGKKSKESTETTEQPTGVATDPEGQDGPTIDSQRPSGRDTGKNNYRLSDADRIETGGKATKFDRNLEAIRLLQSIESDGRLATVQEQSVLAKFTGWGQHGQMFLKDEQLRKLGIYDPRNLDEFVNLESFDSEAVADILEQQARENARRKDKPFNESRLSSIRAQASRVYQLVSELSPREYQKARRSARNSHYTSPEVARSMWTWIAAATADKHGALRVLEPSEGSGIFWGTMPEEISGRVEAHGIDPDDVSHRIARQLYQNVRHANRKFEDVPMPDNFYDVVVSNVPFAPSTVIDPHDVELRKANASLHNYFFLKAAKKVREGGIVAFITSHYTMDSVDPGVRNKIASLGLNFLGAVRLNSEAFGDIAGTEVTTDIIFLQKGAIDKALIKPWIEAKYQALPTRKAEGGAAGFPVNEYFSTRAGARNVIGKMTGNGTMRSGEPEFTVEPDGRSIADELPVMLQSIAFDRSAFERGTAAPESELTAVTDEIDIPDALRDVAVGSIVIDGENMGLRQRDSIRILKRDFKKSRIAKPRVEAWINLRNIALELKAAQIDPTATDSTIESLRAELNKSYDSFVKKYNPVLNQYNRSLFAPDWSAPDVWALEEYDRNTETAKKADIFRERTQFPPAPPTSAKNPSDALIISVQQKGGFDRDYIAQLLNIDPEKVIDRMGDMVMKNPEGGYELREIYLSGNVRRKLAIAKQAAAADPSYQKNVDALTEVIPSDLPPGQILVRIGAPWLPGDVYARFLEEVMGVSGANVSHIETDTGGWSIDYTGASGRGSETNKQEFGTSNYYGHEIFEQLINSREVKVTIRDRDGSVNVEASETATKQAQERADKIKTAFTNWIWTDADRTNALVRTYNDIHRSHVDAKIPSWAISKVGLAEYWANRVRDYQLSGAGRIAYVGNTLLAYVVGAGKTLTATIGIMNARRIGNWRKTTVVVPNHLVQQWAGEVKQYYPQARVLAATEDDFTPERRQTLFARIGTGNYDLIVIPESSFKRMPMSHAYMESYFSQQVMEFEQMIEEERAQQGDAAPSVKELEEQKENFENRMRKLLNASEKDPGPFFDELGIDSLVVDEAHNFKNLFFRTRRSRTPGINPTGNQKTFDMLMKTDYINAASNERGVLFLTGTPIANTMGEAWVMQRYLQPGLMKQSGVFAFDDWASTFGEVETTARVDPIGRKFRMETRFNQFINLPELRRMWGQMADIKMLKDIELPRPPLLHGKPHTEVVKSGPLISDYMFGLAKRAGDMPNDPRVDNILKVMSDGLKAAVDIRMLDPNATPLPNSKLNRVAESAAKIYRATDKIKGTQIIWLDTGTPKKEKKLTDEMVDAGKWLLAKLRDGETVSIPDLRDYWNGISSQKDKAKRFRSWLAMIADDLRVQESDSLDEDAVNIGGSEDDNSNPPQWISAIDAADDTIIESKPPRWNAYQEIKNQLVSQGVNPDEVVFIHDVDSPAKRLDTFAAMNNGKVRIILASTRKLGTGANIQQRLVAMHHVDAPWRPADLEQRDGRILRPGNLVLKLAKEAGINLSSLLNGDPSYGRQADNYLDSLSNYQRSQLGESEGVLIKRYVTDGSIDARYWQTLEDKSRMLEQFYGGDDNLRSTADISQTSMDYAEVKAAAAKDPRFIEKVRTEARVRDLEASQRAFFDDQHSARSKIQQYEGNIAGNERAIARSRKELADLREALAKAPADSNIDVTIDGTRYLKQKDAGNAINAKLAEIGEKLPVMQIAADDRTDFSRTYRAATSGPVKIGTVYGKDLYVDVLAGWRHEVTGETMAGNDMNMAIIRQEEPESQAKWKWSFAGATFGFELHKGTVTAQLRQEGNFQGNASGNASRLVNQFDPDRHESAIARDIRENEQYREQIPKLQSLLVDQWPRTKELDDARARLSQLNEELGGDSGDTAIQGWVMSEELYDQLGGQYSEAANFMRSMTGNTGLALGTITMPNGEKFDVWTGRNHLAPGGVGQYPPRPGMVWIAPKDSIDGTWEKLGDNNTVAGQKIEPPPKADAATATQQPNESDNPPIDLDSDDDQEISPDDVGDPGMPMMPAHQNIATAVTSTGPNMPQSINGAPSPKVRPIAVTEVMRAIRDATVAFGKDIPFRVGRISKPSARGVFEVWPEIIRLRWANDISTAAHELGHAIEKLAYGWKKGGPWKAKLIGRKAVKELMKLGKNLYPNKNPVGGWKREGFAEFAKYWIIDPQYAKNEAPEFTKWFETEFLAKSPAGKLALERAQSAAARYIGQTEFDRGDTGIVDQTGFLAKVKKLAAYLRDAVSFQAVWEEVSPLRDAEKAAEIASMKTRGRGLSISEMPYTRATALRNTAASRVRTMVYDEMIDINGSVVTGIKPLAEIKKLVPLSKAREWIVYMWAKRAQALLEDPRGPRNPGMTLADAKSIIAQSETPQFAEAAQIFYAWNNGVLDYAAGASPTLAEAVDKIRARDPGFYIPLKREFDQLERLYTSTSDKSVTAGSLAGKLKGSGRRILHPIQQAIVQAQQIVQAAHDRAILEAVLRLDRIEGMGEHVTTVKRDKIPVAKKDLSELIETVQKRLERQNIELYDQNGDPIDATNHAGELVTFFAFARQPKAGESIIPVWNGTTKSVRWYQVNPRIYDAIVPHVQQLGMALKTVDLVIGLPLRVTAQMLRLGATGWNLTFGLIINGIRDARSLTMNTQATNNFIRAYWNFLYMLPGALGDALELGPKFSNRYIRLGKRLGGRGSQMLKAQSGATSRVADSIFGRRVSFIPTWREALSVYENIVQITDTAARSAEIKMISENNRIDVEKPLSLEDSFKLLLAYKQVTTDFSATGSITKFLGQYIPFLRSSLQGPRAAGRAFVRSPVAYLIKGMQTAALAAALWYALKDEEWWEEVDPNDKLRSFFIPVTIAGRKEIIQIPVNQDADFVFGTGMIAALDALHRQNPKAATEWATAFVAAANPIHLPPLADELREQWKNEDSFTGKPIVPDEYKNRKPEQQFGDRTPELTKWLGEQTGLSPMRIDHAVTGMTGSVGRGAVKLASSAMTGSLSGTQNEAEPADQLVIGRLFKRGGPLGFQPRSVTDFYDLSRKAEQIKEDIKVPETESHKERRLVLEDAKKALGAISAVSRVAKTVDEQRDLTRQKVAIAKRAVELYSSPSPSRVEMAAMRKAWEYKATVAAGESAKANKMFANLKESAESKPSTKKGFKKTLSSKDRARIADHERESASARAALRLIRGG